MINKTVAFVYNVRHTFPDPNDLNSQVETDFDDPQTIENIARHLKECGYEVILIEANQEAYLDLYRHRSDIDIVFNYSMGLNGSARYAHIPAMLEMLQLPYTGSDPLTQALVMNKSKMQDVLAANGVPVLSSQVFSSATDIAADNFPFPIIVKPIAQGSSAGITSLSVVRDLEELKHRVGEITSLFREPAIVQPFLDGREFSIPMLGNPPMILPIIEPDFSKLPTNYERLDSLEVKWIYEEQSADNHLICPAILDSEMLGKIVVTARNTWKALNIRDWCRIDIRCDNEGNPYVIDVNSPPGIIPPETSMTSYFPLSARVAGVGYQDLLKMVIESALGRL